MTISSRSFGTSPDGKSASLWSIENSSGLSFSVTDWGATLVSLLQPDRNGIFRNVLLGFEDASRYLKSEGYQGATCGRFANRIARGQFELDGKVYELVCNNGSNHLHGGEAGFNSRIWEASPYTEGDRSGVVFSCISPDGEENYPGELKIQADYAMDESGKLYMEFRGETDAPTIINITNHAYWNLSESETVLDHELVVHSSRYIPVDDSSIPTGSLDEVDGSPFDFREAKIIGAEIDKVPGGYDHCMVIDGQYGELRPAVEVRDPKSGRKLSLLTDRPGVQLYTGNYLDGRNFPKHGGLCLEPEDFPDAPNRPSFPSTVLRPGEIYHHRSVLEFSTD